MSSSDFRFSGFQAPEPILNVLTIVLVLYNCICILVSSKGDQTYYTTNTHITHINTHISTLASAVVTRTVFPSKSEVFSSWPVNFAKKR